MGARRHAGRFRPGPGRDRGRADGRALPGRHVPVFEHALCGRAARGERRMRVRGVGDGVLPCGLAPRVMVFDNAAGRVGQNHHRRRVPRFVERYRVEVRFCNPGSGWELFAR